MGTYPKEVFRKSLHMIGVAGVIVWFYTLDDWRQSITVTLAITVVIYPMLYLGSRIPGMTEFFNARKKGEYAKSFAALFLTYIMVAAVCWGYFNQRILGVASFMAWGPGDAAAALVGKRYGKHKIGRKKAKTLEGSTAMFVLSLFNVLFVLYLSGLFSIPALILVSLITAIVTTITELKVLGGYDTLFCPLAAMTVLCISYMIIL
ncbi:MAG: phosphatidate cytidylyltransferase [Butyrivibrio sp.]|nr:phosphatidate cytidylyltransferase [Butyrivibrio sp.]